jgi:hypothetical protein
MDLAWNRNPEFTKWVVSAGLLTEPLAAPGRPESDGAPQ